MNNNKYLAFCGNGNTTGWDGFRGSFGTIDEAILFLNKNYEYNWAEVVDIEQLKTVWSEFGQD
jgi:hypothetical protein